MKEKDKSNQLVKSHLEGTGERQGSIQPSGHSFIPKPEFLMCEEDTDEL